MKKIKKIKKIISSLAGIVPLFGGTIPYQISKNKTLEETITQVQMGDIVVNVKTDSETNKKSITEYVSGEGILIVSSDIDEISQGAFAQNSNLKQIDFSLATKLTKIGSLSFYNCPNVIGSITIPKTVTEISDAAFVGVNADNIFFLGSKPNFSNWYWIDDEEWTGKVYVPLEMKNTYLSDPLFHISESKVFEWSFDSSSANITGEFGSLNVLSSESNVSKKYVMTGFSEEILSEMATWELVPTGETKEIPDGLILSKGIIYYRNLIPGTYSFRIKASLFDYTILSNEVIHLTSFDPQINGVQNIFILSGISGEQKYSLSSNPKGLTANKWEIAMNEGQKPDWLSINEQGVLSWSGSSTSGNYNFKLICTPNTLSQKAIEFPISLTSYTNLKILGETNISGITGKSNFAKFEVYSEPSTIVVDSWEIEMTEGQKPDWLRIDNQGLLSWTNQCVAGTYKFKVVARNIENNVWIESSEITLNILDSLEIIGKTKIYSYISTNGSEQYTSVVGKDLDQWEIQMIQGDKPEWLSINNSGLLSWNYLSTAGIYKFKIIASSTKLGVSVESKEITLNISSERIVGASTINNKTGSLSTSKYMFISTQEFESVDQWEIVEQTNSINWLSIDNTGLLKIDPTAPAGIFEIKLKATNSQTKQFAESSKITIINFDQAEISGERIIDALSGSSGSEKYNFSIKPESITLDQVEIIMSEGIKPDWLSIDNTGLLSWTDQCVVGTYKFKIRAVNQSSPNIYCISDEIVLNLYQNTGIITGESNIQVDEKKSGQTQFNFFTTPEGLIADQWEIVMIEGDKPDWLSIDNNGLLSWTNKSVEGTYKFKIKAKNSDLNISAESGEITLTIIHIPNKTHIPLTLGLSLGLGIPLILGIAFIIWYFTHKRKTKVKI